MIGFLLPAKSVYDNYYGGPVIRWVAFAVSGLKKNNIKYRIFGNGRSGKEKMLRKPLSLINYMIKISANETISSWLWCINFYFSIKGCSILHIQNRPHYAIILRRLGFNGIIILHLHNDILGNFDEAYIVKLEKNVSYVIACSNAIVDNYKSLSLGLYQKTIVIRNGVDIKLFSPSSYYRDMSILFVGRIVKQKGLHILLKSYNSLLNRNIKVKLSIAGGVGFGSGRKNSSYFKAIKKEIELINKNGGEIDLLGYLNHDIDLPYVMKNSTILVMPSIGSEAFPMTLLEAMACKNLIVGANFPGIVEAVGNTGLFFTPSDVEQLTDKLGEAITNFDSFKYNIEKGYEMVITEYTWENIIDHYIKFLNEIASFTCN